MWRALSVWAWPKNCISCIASSARAMRERVSSSACFAATSNGATCATLFDERHVIQPGHGRPIDDIAQMFGKAARLKLKGGAHGGRKRFNAPILPFVLHLGLDLPKTES
jgi:hypothetical protein